MITVRLQLPEDWHGRMCDNTFGYDPVELLKEAHDQHGQIACLDNEALVDFPALPQVGHRVYWQDEYFEVVLVQFAVQGAIDGAPEASWGLVEQHPEVFLRPIPKHAVEYFPERKPS